MAGGAIGTVVHRFAPLQTAEPGAYALVGMGTLFAGIIRAPMTSVFMIFEITQDYQILVPLMVANLLSFVISRRFQPVPVYHALLRQDQIHLPSSESRVMSPTWTASDVMGPHAEFVPQDRTVGAVWEQARTDGGGPYLIGTPEQLIGILTRDRLMSAVDDGRSSELVGSLVETSVVHAHPDHPSDVVLERLAQSGGLLPIVSREQARSTVGVVTLDHIMRFVRRRRRGAAAASQRASRVVH
jgi:CIC family chloride channel protein